MAWKETKYSALLRDPRWQKLRLEILNRDNWTCQDCGDTESTLHVHHKRYRSGAKPWEYEPGYLITLCEECHSDESQNGRLNEDTLIEVFRLVGYSNLDLNALYCDMVGDCKWENWPAAKKSAIAWLMRTPDVMEAVIAMHLKARAEREAKFAARDATKQQPTTEAAGNA